MFEKVVIKYPNLKNNKEVIMPHSYRLITTKRLELSILINKEAKFLCFYLLTHIGRKMYRIAAYFPNLWRANIITSPYSPKKQKEL